MLGGASEDGRPVLLGLLLVTVNGALLISRPQTLASLPPKMERKPGLVGNDLGAKRELCVILQIQSSLTGVK